MRLPHSVICGMSGCAVFTTLSHERHDLQEKKIIEHKMRVFILSTTFV